VQEGYLNRDQGKPTLVVDWEDMNSKPYLMEVLGSGILRDMVMEVAVEGKPTNVATARAQKRLEELLKSKGYLK
jgi:multiple sugar transport system substrate-binding protein